ncbi:T9SS type A sorting domain-containing protein [Lewinella sp. LCG006]|uniref:T9SS type A sorting domain-containing protein n=1 Tax=Lewinella sp. LCG006 TaxID=3231911 RepID=UPI00345F3719
MKNAIGFLLLSISFLPSLFGQAINKQYARAHTSVISGISVNNDGRILTAGYYDTTNGSLYVGMTTEEGDYIDVSAFFEESSGSLMNISNIVHDTASNFSYFAVALDGCDVGDSDQLYKINLDNFTREFVELPGSNFAAKYHLAILPDGSVLIGEEETSQANKVVLYRSGSFYELLTSELVRGLAALGLDKFVILGDETLTTAQLNLATNTATTINTVAITDGSAIEALNATQLLVLRSNGLQVWSEDLELLQELTLNNPLELTVDNSYLYVLTADGIHLLNHDLENITLLPSLELDNYAVLTSVAKNDRVYYAGTYEDAYNTSANSTIRRPSDLFIRSFSPAGADILSDTDLAVEMITHSPAEVSLEAPNCMDAIIRDVEVTLRNQGTAVIEEASIMLNLEGCGQNVCPPWIERHWTTEIYLEPGQSTTLSLGTINIYHTQENDEFGLCLWAFPNGETMETDMDNNYNCAVASPIVRTSDLSVNTPFSVYPTLFSDRLTLLLTPDLNVFDQVVVYNLLGQPLQHKPLPPGQSEVVLELEQLPDGSYYLRLEGEGVSQVVMVIKQ